jgi:hypothetical protein
LQVISSQLITKQRKPKICIKENGEPVKLDELDQQACLFWNVPYDKKRYAAPTICGENWFDVFGTTIEHFGLNARKGVFNYRSKSNNDWYELEFPMSFIAANIAFFVNESKNAESYWNEMEMWKPYIDFAFHLNKYGIKAYYIK